MTDLESRDRELEKWANAIDIALRAARAGNEELCKEIASHDRDWKQIAQELGCEPTREDMLKAIRQGKKANEELRELRKE